MSTNDSAETPPLKDFLACLVDAVQDPPDEGRTYGLAVSPTAEVVARGAKRVAMDAALHEQLVTSLASLPRPEPAEVVLLVSLGPNSEVDRVWTVDLWAFIQSRGTALDLRGLNLNGAQLRGARLEGADLREARLRGADLTKADLTATNLAGADLSGACLFSATLHRANLSEADLSRADLRHSDLREVTCGRAAFRGADLWGSYVWNVDLSSAFTEGADFTRCDYLVNKIDAPVQPA